jgi:hypothetical protein
VGELALLIPIIAILTGGVIAVTAIFSGHQRKMIELRGRQDEGAAALANEIHALRQEVAQMRDSQNQALIAMDANQSENQPLPGPDLPPPLPK